MNAAVGRVVRIAGRERLDEPEEGLSRLGRKIQDGLVLEPRGARQLEVERSRSGEELFEPFCLVPEREDESHVRGDAHVGGGVVALPEVTDERLGLRDHYEEGGAHIPNGNVEAMAMRLEGLHHITAITGDAPGNVDFYARVLGLRLVKKTVNQDDPTVYHLFYADELGSAGSDITFFEYPGARRGRRRRGDGAPRALARRLRGRARLLGGAAAAGGRLDAEAVRARCASRPGGSRARARRGRERRRAARRAAPRDPGRARAPGLRGRAGVQRRPGAEPRVPRGHARLRRGRCGLGGARRAARLDATSTTRRRPIAGSRAPARSTTSPGRRRWTSTRPGTSASPRRARCPTPIIDRFWFRSIYFREPSGVLFELATLGPGFTADEPLETLGRALTLPPAFEHLRPQLEQVLTPLPEVTRVG